MITYRTVKEVAGPLIIIQKTRNIGYQEMVTIKDAQGNLLGGQVIALA